MENETASLPPVTSALPAAENRKPEIHPSAPACLRPLSPPHTCPPPLKEACAPVLPEGV
jgi:hypothetical protein